MMNRLASCIFVVAVVLVAGCSTESSPTAATSVRGPEAETGADTARQVTLRVPTMSCTRSCWPAAREALEKQPGVRKVALVPQQDKVMIDTPLITLNVEDSFDVDKALEAVAAAGFANASVEN